MSAGFNIEEYNYQLPEDFIARFPLENREDSKLLIYHGGSISQDRFKNITEYIPENTYLLFNDTKVISARIYFFKETGAKIEVFLLEPLEPSQEISVALEARKTCKWKCTIGNKKKWKRGHKLVLKHSVNNQDYELTAELENAEENTVVFQWNSQQSFAELIDLLGRTPIPPYLHREESSIDAGRYQTVYSVNKGAVAAPTAGLHFTNEIIQSLPEKGVKYGNVTLHVSAGTFKPVQEKDFRDHDMHNEQIIVRKETLRELINASTIYCVGTTSLRTLESLYWIGMKKILGLNPSNFIEKNICHSICEGQLLPGKEVLRFLLNDLENKGKSELKAETEIFIYPGYSFHFCKGLITNFHLPKSTLLLLIAAFIGDNWKKVYEYAKIENFRFLSYGDSSILKL